MKGLLKTAVLLVTFCATAMACGGGGEDALDHKGGDGGGTGNKGDQEEPEQPFVAHITPVDKLNQGVPVINSHADVTSRSSLKMNFRTFTTSSIEEKATYPRYPRVKKMKNGSYILFYHNGSANSNIGSGCDYAISTDMRQWVHKGKLFEKYSITDSKGNKNERRYANCDGLVLSNGDVLAVASYRANNGYRDLPKDAGVELKRSTDNGVTWSEPIEIYQGVTWEPYLLELPSGELHCYFTDSSRTGLEGHGTDTGTVMVVSTDGGKTWKPDFGSLPYYVMRMRWEKDGIVGYNHQMPSVIRLNDNKGLAAALETNYLGKYYISLCYSDKDEWEHLTADQEGPADSNNRAFSGMAPYLGQFPSGETVLFYNASSKYCLKMGDVSARNFGADYQPFSGGYWGSLQVIDSHLMVGTIPRASTGPIQMAQFVLNHRIDAVRRSVKVDGNNQEWANTDHALFVGEKSQVQGTLRCSCDDKNVYFLVEVLDRSLLRGDYATVYISPDDSKSLTNGATRIQVSMDGLKSTETYAGKWNNAEMGVEVKTYVCNDTNEDRIDNYGYIAEISVPRSSLTISSGQVLVNFSITDNKEEEAVSDVSSISRWIPVAGL